jgi:N-acyl-L-homoserine lactone synthetase
MIFVVIADNRRLFESNLIEMHHQRETVFVDGTGWNSAVIADM